MASDVVIANATYPTVPAIICNKSGGGTVRFTDTSATTATDSDVAAGKIYFKSDGSQSTGTASGGATGVVRGTVTYSSNVSTSTSTKICDDVDDIGFTPTAFFFWRQGVSATANHCNCASFYTIGSSYMRTKTLYSGSALTTSGDTNNWTTRTSGYLYFTTNGVFYRSSSSNILASGTWNWVAIQ